MPLTEEEARFFARVFAQYGFDSVNLLDHNFPIKLHIKYFQKTVFLKNNLSCYKLSLLVSPVLQYHYDFIYWMCSRNLAWQDVLFLVPVLVHKMVHFHSQGQQGQREVMPGAGLYIQPI